MSKPSASELPKPNTSTPKANGRPPTIRDAESSDGTSGDGHKLNGQSPAIADAKSSNPPQESDNGRQATVNTKPDLGPPADPLLGLLVVLADAVNDLEGARIAAQGRARALRQEKKLPEVAGRQDALVEALSQLERGATRELEKTFASHPLGKWAKETRGIGLKGLARLLAETGDPAARPNVAKLWAYCGFHVVDGKRPRARRGVQMNWNPEAKKRAFLIASASVKHRDSLYRPVYDQAREAWAERETTDGHKHAHATSMVAKAILRDLWIESRKA